VGRSKSSSEPQVPTLSAPSDLSRRRRTVIVAFGATLAFAGALVLGLLGFLVGLGWWATLVGALVGAALGRLLVQRAASRIIAAVGAVPLHDAPRLENLVDGICVAKGITRPRLVVVDTPTRNACAIALNPRHSTLIVTRGLLDHLNRIELEGVAARELTLVKSGQAALATVVSVITPIWQAAAGRLIGDRADLIADLGAVGVTRYPPGLLDALDKIGADPSVPSAPRWTRHLWIEDPGAPADGRAGSFHSPIEERIATLREL
jgi:heat shock protein HtpX